MSVSFDGGRGMWHIRALPVGSDEGHRRRILPIEGNPHDRDARTRSHLSLFQHQEVGRIAPRKAAMGYSLPTAIGQGGRSAWPGRPPRNGTMLLGAVSPSLPTSEPCRQRESRSRFNANSPEFARPS